MKKLAVSLAVLAILGLGASSCKKELTEAELLQQQLAKADSLQKRGGIIKYTVKVVSAANSTILKAKMSVENAQVTVYQNDSSFTAHTDANGFAYFPNMRIGTATVNVKLKDHAEVDYLTDLTPADNVNISSAEMVNLVRYASTMVPMFPIADPGCATITGKVTAELDLTNTTPEAAAGVTVTAQVDVDDSTFRARYLAPTLGTNGNKAAGSILKFAFQDAIVSTLTDAQGVYTLKVPATVDGLPIKVSVGDYQTTQKLYLENDPVTGEFKPDSYYVNTLFSTTVPASEIPIVKSIYIKISPPNCPLGKIIEAPVLTYSIDNNGTITSVNISKPGIFSAKPAIIAYLFGYGAIFEPRLNSYGQLDTVIVVNGGYNYKAQGEGSYIKSFLVQETQYPIFNFQIKYGTLNKVDIVQDAKGYIYNPDFEIICLPKESIKPTIKLIAQPWSTNNIIAEIQNSGSGIGIEYSSKTYNVILNKNAIYTKPNANILNNVYLGTGNRY